MNILVIAAVVFGVPALIMGWMAMHAPEGREDESGYHPGDGA